eukprot:5849457-Alexandrium_andersonii.AAC.1
MDLPLAPGLLDQGFPRCVGRADPGGASRAFSARSAQGRPPGVSGRLWPCGLLSDSQAAGGRGGAQRRSSRALALGRRLQPWTGGPGPACGR